MSFEFELDVLETARVDLLLLTCTCELLLILFCICCCCTENAIGVPFFLDC